MDAKVGRGGWLDAQLEEQLEGAIARGGATVESHLFVVFIIPSNQLTKSIHSNTYSTPYRFY